MDDTIATTYGGATGPLQEPLEDHLQEDGDKPPERLMDVDSSPGRKCGRRYAHRLYWCLPLFLRRHGPDCGQLLGNLALGGFALLLGHTQARRLGRLSTRL
jgi:hypothetical protein